MLEEFNLRKKLVTNTPHALAIGASTGGLTAISTIFEKLRGSHFSLPIFITQHIANNFDKGFLSKISRVSGLDTRLGETGLEVEDGCIYIAPSNYHMIVKKSRDFKVTIKLLDSEPVNYCKPAVDPMFSSIAEVYKEHSFGVILTGIGKDGLAGSRDIVNKGGVIIAQDRATSVVYGMPSAVAKDGLCSAILPIDEVADFIKKHSFGKIV